MKRNLLTNLDKPRPADAKVGANRLGLMLLVMVVMFGLLFYTGSIGANIIPKLYLPSRNTPSGDAGWTFVSATTDNAATDYWKMILAASSMESPAMDFSAYTGINIALQLQSFGTITSHSDDVKVEYWDGSTWIQVGSNLHTTSTAGIQNVSLPYSYAAAKIRITAPNETASAGARIISVEITGTLSAACSITLTSAAGTNAQTACAGSSITNITYATTVATGANFSGLPSGVSGSWTLNVATVSGTPTIAGTYNYTVTLTGGGCSTTANGSITVNTPPTDPTGTITPAANPACGSTTLSYSGASANIYWQTSATGTSTANPTTSNLTVTSSGTYYVRAYNGTCWSTNSLASAAITINAAPTITTQPTNQTKTEPATATFSVVASNATGYQWQLSTDNGSTWSNISGATSASYTTGATSLAMSGYQYRCIASATPCSPATSNAATLTVNSGPCLSESAFTALPAGWSGSTETYAAGEAVFGTNNCEFSTLALSNPTSLTFDLRRTTNTTAKTLYVEISTTTQGGTYTTVATYDHSNTTSGATTACTVDLSAYTGFSPVFIKFRKASSTTSPWYLDNVNVFCSSGPNISVGSITSFGSACVGSTSAEKSYTVSGTNLTGNIIITPPANFEISTTSGSGFVANPSTITLTQSGGTVAPTTIYVVFKPTAVQAYSANITHTSTGATTKNVAVSGSGVNSSTITSHPSNQNVSDGGNALFMVAATVVSSYQWQISTDNGSSWNNLSNGAPYSNVTTAIMTITGVSLAMTGYQYRCVITSACGGTINSNAGILNVFTGSIWLIDEGFDATTDVTSLATTTDGPFTATAGLFTGPSATIASRQTNALFLSADGTLTTPTFANGDLLAFWMGLNPSSSGQNIVLTIEQTTDGTNWSTLASFTDIPIQTLFYYYPIAANIIQIRFVYDEGNNNDIYLDDIMVRSAGMCSSTPLIEKVHVNSCAATEEGRNEFVLVDVDQAINVSDLVITFPSADPGTLSFCMACDKTFVTNPTYTAAMNTLAGCTVAVEPSGVIPANSKLVIFTGAVPEFTYDLSDACGTGVTYYVIYCDNANVSGRFANDPTAPTLRHVSIMDQGSGCYDQVYYDTSIPNVDGEFAYYDLITRVRTYGNNGCTEAILPVSLLYLISTCNEGEISLHWSTATETNNAYFTVEAAESANGDFVPVAKVDGAGNSNEVLQYSVGVETSARYFRLKQTDYDGKYSYSDVIAVDCEDNQVQVFPTLASEGDEINIIGEVSSVRVFDSMSREINPEIRDNRVCCLEPGMYFFVINTKWTYKVIVQ